MLSQKQKFSNTSRVTLDGRQNNACKEVFDIRADQSNLKNTS